MPVKKILVTAIVLLAALALIGFSQKELSTPRTGIQDNAGSESRTALSAGYRAVVPE